MRNLVRGGSVSFRNLSITLGFLLLQLFILILFTNATNAQPPKILLEQSANGPAEAPLSPTSWIKGHLGHTNSHYTHGSVIPYRAIVSNVPIDCPLKIRLSFLATKKGKHATDFPTNYDQSTLEHINEFGSWESVDPLSGLTGNFTGPTSSEFPLVPNLILFGDQSTTQSNNLYFLSNYGPQRMSAWNADISNIYFVGYGERNPNDGGDGKLVFDVIFTATSSPVVFAWGGHIAYDTLSLDGQWGYSVGQTLGSGSSSTGGLTECLSLIQAAAEGGGGQSFIGNTGEITYSLSGGKPINPTSTNTSEGQREESPTIQKPKVFPNPSKGKTIVTLPSNSESFDIRLIDVSGKIIKRWSDYKNSRLELTGLKSGMYILNITSRTSQDTSVLKVIVMN